MEDIVAKAVKDHQPKNAAGQQMNDAGIAVAVMNCDEVIFARGYGLRDRGLALPVEDVTSFAIGSATKAFTSMAVSMLVAQGKVSLTVPVTTYIPDFTLQDPVAGTNMTLQDVLCHRTGILPHNSLWYLSPLSRRQLLHALKYLQPNTAPGKGFRNAFEYHNITYSVAAAVLEIVSGQTWDDFLKTQILGPLGMTSTTLSLAGLTASPNRARGYAGDKELPAKDFDNIGHSALINSDVRDLARWVLLHLNHGSMPNGTQLIAPQHLDNMHAPLIQATDDAHYGLGWYVTSFEKKPLIFHTGNADGYSVYASFMPEDGFGVIALSNQHATKFPNLVAEEIYKYLLTKPVPSLRSVHEFAHQIGTFAAEFSDGHEVSRVMSAQAAAAAPLGAPAGGIGAGAAPDYTGMFSHPAFGDVSVTKLGTDFMLSYYGIRCDMRKTGNADEFFVLIPAFGAVIGPMIRFGRDASGEINGFTIEFAPGTALIPFVKQ